MTRDRQPSRRPRRPPGVPRGFPFVPSARARPPREEQAPVGTVTFLFSDMVGASTDIQRRGDRQARAFHRRHDEIVRTLAAQHDGHIVRQQGDGFFITFRSAREALRCAIGIQRGIDEAYGAFPDGIHVRIGLHVGETVEEGGDYYGTAVNLAARVGAEAGADEIVVTGLVQALAAGEPEFQYRFLRETELRGIAGRVRLFLLLWREAEIAEAQRAEPVAHAQAEDEADALRRYASELERWTRECDLSEWHGRYIELTARLSEGRGVLAHDAGGWRTPMQECLAAYGQLVLSGEGGSGKTTALLEATRRAAETLAADPAAPIPIFVAMRGWRDGVDALDLLREALAARGLVTARDGLQRWLADGRCVLLLDGANELPDAAAEPAALAEIGSFAARFPRSRYIVSTRRPGFDERLAGAPVAELQPLRPHDVLQYLLRYVGDAARAEAIFRSLGGRDRASWLQPDSLIGLARNPLVLNVVISEELTAGGSLRPSRAAVLGACARYMHRTDLQRGSRLAPEVKELLLAAIAYAASERGAAGLDRADLAQTIRDVLVALREVELVPQGLDVTTVLAELDRRFLAPLVPDPARTAGYHWSHRLFHDYFTAIELRRRFFPPAGTRDRRPLEELLAGDAHYRWEGAVVLLAELLEAAVPSLLESCLRADNAPLACRCLAHAPIANAAGVPRGAGAASLALAALIWPADHAPIAAEASLQEAIAVLCEALLEQEPPGETGVEPPSAWLGVALLASRFGVEASGVLAALSLGLPERSVTAVSWALGARLREVRHQGGHLLRLRAVPPVAGPSAQHVLRQGLLLALARAPDVLLLECCRRAEALIDADRLPAPQARTLARDTAGVHAAVARRLALWPLADLLDDLCHATLDPAEFEQAAAVAEDLRLHRREQRLDWLGDVLDERLQRVGIAADVQTAMPSVHGIALELRQLGALQLPRAALRGLGRIVVNVADEPSCERALLAIQELWPGTLPAEPELVPLIPAVERPGRRELVAYPAEGGFLRILLQTVSPDQLDVDRRSAVDPVDRNPLRARMQRLLDELAIDADGRNVFVLTLSGEVVALPDGATPIDFAYHIHSRLGHRCAGALVNGEDQPLSYRLKDGDRVEILVDRERRLPPDEWLERRSLVFTPRARRAIQQALDAARRDDALAFGREIVQQELKPFDAGPALVGRLLKALGFQREERLFEAVGRAELSRRELAYTLKAVAGQDADGEQAANLPQVENPAGLRVRFARCCRPQPGDAIVGYRSGQAVVVHTAACPEGAAVRASHDAIDVDWKTPVEPNHILLRVATEEPRALAPAARRLAAEQGIELLDLAGGRSLGERAALTLECPADDERLPLFAERLRRLAGVTAVEFVQR